jgi:hypothetical protein
MLIEEENQNIIQEISNLKYAVLYLYLNTLGNLYYLTF